MSNNATYRKEREMKKKKPGINEYLAAICSVLGVVVISVTAVFVVRALLNDYTETLANEFSSMTYTNIEISEPSPHDYTVVFNTDGYDYNDNDHSGVITKEAEIRNLTGSDKKPVYVRAKVIMTIYDNKGYNITALYSGFDGVSLNTACLNCMNDESNWTEGPDHYYYYKRILLPGDTTVPLFKYGNTPDSWNKVVVDNAAKLPSGSVIHIDVLADAVQAVDTDSIKWKTGDFYDEASLDNVETAWGVSPTLPATEGNDFNGNGFWFDGTDWQDIDEAHIPDLLAGQFSIWCVWPEA